MATATLEIDQALLQTLQTRASEQGLSVDALLRKYAENGNGAAHYLQDLYPESDTQETIGERLERKGLLGIIDSSLPLDPDSPPYRDALFDMIADKLKKQGITVP